MKKLLSLMLALVIVSAIGIASAAEPAKRERVIITTDLEVDDINGILLTLMYANEMDIAGLVHTAGEWHFEGDGEHTLGEITPNAANRVEGWADLTSFRPAEPGLLQRLISTYYADDYANLALNNSDYPTPEYLLSVTKTGNTAFEGDVRFDTEGSELIKACILDDDPRQLYIHHWGGINTTARALLSIYEEYHETDQWDAILNKVVSKVVLVGTGEDNCYADTGIAEKFPGIVVGGLPSYFSYGTYGSAVDGPYYYQSEWLLDAFKKNHGEVLGAFHLVGDGQVLYGEPMVAQYGLKTWVDFKELRPKYSFSTYPIPRWDMDRNDWLCCQFSSEYIDIGLRRDVTNKEAQKGFGNSTAVELYREIMFEELAARADWAILPYDQCNHAPVVKAETLDFTAVAGETVNLSAEISDPDGDELTVVWSVPTIACVYAGDLSSVTCHGEGTATSFTVPADAVSGERFVVNMQVRDNAARPMTRFAQFVITVK